MQEALDLAAVLGAVAQALQALDGGSSNCDSVDWWAMVGYPWIMPGRPCCRELKLQAKSLSAL
jgi:hypothetical protein